VAAGGVHGSRAAILAAGPSPAPAAQRLGDRSQRPALLGQDVLEAVGPFLVPLIGLTAIGAARSVRGGQVGRAVAWNLLGLLDLVVALSIGLAAAPGPLRRLAVTPSTAPLAVLPLVLIPTFLVPLSILLHVVSLRSLAGARAAVRAVS
jgi:hypothetical protein